jgi:hypothetical protein
MNSALAAFSLLEFILDVNGIDSSEVEVLDLKLSFEKGALVV